jgi:hypothetical protein
VNRESRKVEDHCYRLPLNIIIIYLRYKGYNEEIFENINEIHLNIGHGGRNRMIYNINLMYKNITRKTIMLYLNLSITCQKKGSTTKKRFSCTTDPILRNEFGLLGRLDRHISSVR